ncbi:MAG: NYN domain-containing protein [Spirochaetes bacterium]|nr:NYN domain-containing protein [Spirochaetota bacterium]
MAKTSIFIDGFNLYHALIANSNYSIYRWLDLSKLTNCFVMKKDTIADIYYFTALAAWSSSKVKKHKTLIKALELKGIKTVYGEFKRKDRKCRICKKSYQTFEEKQTDVNIALQLFQDAILDKYDKAIIVSGDSDLIPSIKAVQHNFPKKSIGVVIPIGGRSEALKNTCDFHIKMKIMHLQSSRFPNEIDLGNGYKISCPIEWR